jgi:subtilisin family serine protease
MKTILLISLLLASSYLYSQNRMIVYLSDKGDSKNIQFSDRAIQRRQKNNVATDDYDKALHEPYLVLLESDCKILNRSRWLNAVTVETELSEIQLSEKYTFISDIWVDDPTREVKQKFEEVYSQPKVLNYGVADTQVRQIDADCLHDMGFTGTGVYLAVIDAGFRGMDTVSYFDSVYTDSRVLDTYDFVNGITVYDYSSHGTAVSSCIFGEKGGAGQYAGTAVDVDVALYVSEDVASETLIEEFNLVSALERCDSVGVDLVNISLGYTTFDDPNDDHSYVDMNGNTTIAATGVNIAASKGIIVLSAAGNSGPSTISTPCDADDGLCVGAVDNQGTYAPFSSIGPASDGQVKPDVSATGWNTWVIIDDGSLLMGSGTSFATPVMAGGVACLIQSNPQKTANEIKEALRQSGSQFLSPDEFMGYGIPQLCSANSALGLPDQKPIAVKVYPNPVDDNLYIEGLSKEKTYVSVINALGQEVMSRSLNPEGGKSSLSVRHLKNGVYFVKVNQKVHRVVISH